jgi:predicted nucleotidyltransferase
LVVHPRATGDMDIWVAMHPANAGRLVNLLREFGFSSTPIDPALFLQEKKVIRIGNSPLRIELLTSISGVRFEECYSRRIVTALDGVEVNVIGLDDLKANKKASGRPKDLSDLDQLPKKNRPASPSGVINQKGK